MSNERITRADVAAYKRDILDQSVLITVDAAAEILSCSVDTVRRRIREGQLSAYVPSGSDLQRGTRILAAELRDFVRSTRVAPGAYE